MESISDLGVLLTERTMTRFEQHKIDSDHWYSPPFYTHRQGYKMCLKVNANGDGEGKGTHVSAIAYLMRGEFDDYLQWPFRGHVVIQLCNQLQDKYHRGHTFDFSETTDAEVINRVTSGERADRGWGCDTLIPHNDLNFNPTTNSQYLKNDRLRFRIVDIEVPGVLPTRRTMIRFEQHKIENDNWFSPPFYTHPQGYKMCLKVDANGDGEGKGTHVSAIAYLIRGEFDDHLQWPFRGRVVIQLCNQLQDKYHRGHTIDFSETTDDRIISRVTTGERADSGRGCPTLIPHNDLNFNPTYNCQYLKNDCLRFQIVAIESLSEPGVLPTRLTMTNFEQHKTDSDQWYSPPFYTHPQGYKMCLRVDANGDGKGKGTHVSVSAYLMQGEFDDHLKWPIRGHVVIQLCNQLQDKYHCGRTMDFSEETNARIIGRVTSGERADSERGCSTLIPHKELNINPTTICQYLKNDCLHFQIVAMESLSEPGVLPTERTMTNFEQHKIDSDHWYSPPFYTHPQGYKMCLKVYANGTGKGKGTHVSVSAYLMRGEFDDHLEWPFRGHVVIQLCNQLQDKYHRGHTIDFSETADARIISRVTSGERADSERGYPTLIPHNDLNFNPTNNCQYLKNDYLHFQIVAVESLSEPGVLPTERTMTSFEQHKIDHDGWYSPPFYTHPQGYKMCLKVYANGTGKGKGTHVSVFAYLMRGEFDDHLEWSFRGRVVIQLCNQLHDKYHHGHTIDFSETTYARVISRVTSGERADRGWGCDTLIPHNDLNFNPTTNCQYLKNNCLRFQIVDIEVPGMLPTRRTMTRFEQHKIESDNWFSTPFYTHTQWYKMCLKVNANGDGEGKGTHVSAIAYLMRGEFDDYLQWPFRGHVVIQLCNQLQDKYHRGRTFDFSETTDAEVISRVTSGERADRGWGCDTLIPHNDLNFNPTTNSQYLKNDCLRFRIVDIEVPGVLPTRRTMTRFEQHKIESDNWFSPPFYTHTQGYKMCLKVDANGDGEGKGTHVSAIAYLMRGKFDDHLQWPFRGRVVIQLCNQLQDKYHRGRTIDFSETTDDRIISRVTTGERADSGFGSHTLIPHNDLNFNPTTNCQYLKNDCLRFQIVAIESLSEPGVLPTRLTMTNFEQHKTDSDRWYSPPFYTHPQGYKMCLRVDANGDGKGKGTHVSVSAYLMQGEFDDHLKWPIRGDFVIQLCNQLQDKYHCGRTMDFSEETNARIIGQVTSAERAGVGRGCSTLIPHKELNINPTNNCQYLKNDCLHFQIVAVESLSEPGVLPTERTMTNFGQHKVDSDHWYSPPFYTHPQGYKMCLKVYANGTGKGKGTHVSVSAYLMRGEFDDHLEWPFRGHVVIQLCNQLQDKYHHGHTIDFSETADARIISRVTSGERDDSGWGCDTLIPHNDLNFNPTTNSQYLKNDCLHFQIVAVESLSEPGVLPTERTMTRFEQHKIDSDQWFSPPFYTHPQGYMMGLSVVANGGGKGKGTHVSVFAHLMRGEFDDHLTWPFRGRVVIQLCNQLQDKYHRGHTIDFSETTDDRIISRVTSGERADSGRGCPTLIPHNDLNFNPTTNCQYLKNDCLRFQIVAIESLSEPGVLPTRLTMTNFEQHKVDSDQWYSPPFYTHPQGYMMGLSVVANGGGKGKGTHVSVFAHLMRGEFDDHLTWPFRGRVVIQLCNQLQDKYHRGHTIDFSETTDDRIISRVTSGERADSGQGCPTLIPHNDLNFNPTTNCQYLKNDCLRFQIVAIESLSEPGVLPTRLTMTNFEQHKVDSDQWYSPPFYTHPQGYKMCLRVDANGRGEGIKGILVSAFVYLMRGGFDDVLKWPFQGHIVVELCNQLQDKYHHGYTIDFSIATDTRNISRVTSGERADSGWGRDLILHHDIDFNPATNCQYLKNDCLRFQIVAVESLSEPGVLPTRRTMTNFEQHKTDSDQLYSPPFYTHPQGYKMCLRVDANGDGKGKGTHVSVSAYLMQGEFDDHLKWPFQGHIVVELCNQLQDKYHHGYTIDFSETTDARVISRVTSGERANSGWGRYLILHNDINFNPATNCQYLKNDCLRFQIVAVESLSEPGVLPTERTMTNFAQDKLDSDHWYSRPFYTHPQGYKMCLKVYANGSGKGKGTHVSVYAYLMRGEFDDHLKWPFRGCVVIQLCNQLQDKYHHGYTIDFSETTDARVISRVTSGERADSGWGCDLIPHSDLNFNPTNNCQYLKNDCLYFKIVAVESLSEPGVLPTERTMIRFEQHKIDSDQWFSPPFYTHPQGYKMCLRVDVNGDGKGKGTPVSVFAYLMRGEFDDLLEWPFRGRVVIQLCNQLQDKYHHGHTIDFSETTDARVISRVTSGERADSGWGCDLIPHSDLNFNPTNNCQYLKNDCLYFQIVAVESLSEPGVLPTERTMTRFEQHKIDHDFWYSPPFYTHPQGYKMGLKVVANGVGDSEGTHVSVFAYLMRGESDDHLKWPFQGHVTVAMLNQLEDNNHTTRTIPYTDTTNNEVVGRVTEGERAPIGFGYRSFIPHTELNYNPTKNCQYLKYDCLRFRIDKVHVELK